MRRTSVSGAIALVAILIGTMPAGAISGGELDGRRHPNVGALGLHGPEGQFALCSGVLISQTAYLTTAGCAAFGDFVVSIGGSVGVSFARSVDETTRLIPAESFSIHPDTNFNNGFYLYGIVELARSVGITPAELPALGLLDAVKKRNELTVVGYGGVADCSGPGTCELTFDGRRRFATASIAALDPGAIELQLNSNATGEGGVCFGDDGAPYFLGDSNIVVGVQDGGAGWQGSRNPCNSIAFAWRTDTEIAQSYLDDFAPVP